MHPFLSSLRCIVHCIKINRISHQITHVLIQCMGDSFCVYEGIKRQIIGVICNILSLACKKANISCHFAGWGSSLSDLSSPKPGRFSSKKPAVSAKMHPLWTIWAKRPEYRRIVPSMESASVENVSIYEEWQLGR